MSEVIEVEETLTEKMVRYSELAKQQGAKRFKFTVMRGGIDFGCHVDFGQGWTEFYPDKVA